jgi:hypothetical protein
MNPETRAHFEASGLVTLEGDTVKLTPGTMRNVCMAPVTPCYIFDIDGTLADLTHRRHHVEKSPKNWPAFHAGAPDDKPIKHICALARRLYWAARDDDLGLPYEVVLMTGRHENLRAATERWLHEVAHLPFVGPLYMRADGDFRDDSIVKLELLQRLRVDRYEPIMAFDDRDRVVKMWRENGVPCLQVAPGDF